MKLQLNLPALERLLGDDPEIVVDLRHQVVNAFAKRYLKDVAESEAFKQILQESKAIVADIAKEAQKETRKQVEAQIGTITNTSYAPKVKLTSAFQQKIRAEVADAVTSQTAFIQDEIERKLQVRTDSLKHYYAKQLEAAVKKMMDDGFTDAVKTEVARVLAHAASISGTRAKECRAIDLNTPE